MINNKKATLNVNTNKGVRVFWIICICAFVAAMSPLTATAALDNIAQSAKTDWEAIYNTENLEQYVNQLVNSVDRDAYSFVWHEPIIMQSLVNMYEATGTVSYMTKVKDHAATLFNYRSHLANPAITDQLRICTIPGWLTNEYTVNDKYYAFIAHQGYICYPILRWISLVNSDSDLSSYRATADTYLGYIEDLLDVDYSEFEAEVQTSGSEIWYDIDEYRVNENKTFSPGDPAPYNYITALGSCYAKLYEITGETKYRTRAAGMATFFLNDLETVGDRYQWKYSAITTNWESLSYAAIDMDFVWSCYENGIVFTGTHMQKFVNMFNYVCNGSSGAADTVYGGFDSDHYDSEVNVGLLLSLATYAPSIRDDYWDYYSAYKGYPNWQIEMLSLSWLVLTSQDCTAAAASAPVPANGTQGVAVTGTTLRWTGCASATKYKVYFGASNPPPYVAETTSTQYSTGTLLKHKTYYWRIDTVACNQTITGTVWNFSTPRTFVSINLGTSNSVNNLKLIDTVSNGNTEAVTITDANNNTRTARRTKDSSDNYFYFDVLNFVNDYSYIAVKITYFDNTNTTLRLDYCDDAGYAWHVAGYKTRTNTNTWKDWIVYIYDAALSNCQYGGADFRVGSNYSGYDYVAVDYVSVQAKY